MTQDTFTGKVHSTLRSLIFVLSAYNIALILLDFFSLYSFAPPPDASVVYREEEEGPRRTLDPSPVGSTATAAASRMN